MVYHSVAEIYAHVEAARTSLYQKVQGLSAAQAGFKNGADRWSIAEILEHLNKAEKRTVKRVGDAMAEAEIDGKLQALPGRFEPFSMDYVERSRQEKYKAPEFLVPAGGIGLADLLLRLRASRAELLSLRPRLEAHDVSRVCFPHPVFGPLNLYQWLALVAFHEGRHLEQIESVMAAAGFPAVVDGV
jgi:hypothetical protein